MRWIRWVTFGFLWILSYSSFGQLKVQVLNENQQPMSYVQVFTNDFSFNDLTNELGEVILPKEIPANQVVVFTFLGFEQTSRSKFSLIEDPVIILKKGLLLDEVVVIGRNDQAKANLPNQVQTIDAKVFKLTNPQTSADALEQHSDVYIQRSQMGGGSPIIRGFEANRVLLVVDGVRMNNAIYRSGHLQNAITIDNSMLERLEVLYGPGSLIYGSDAIGGVVHFRSKNPKLNFNANKKVLITGNAYARYSTANNEKSAHVDLNIGSRKLAMLSSFSYSDYDDLRMGSKRSDVYPDFGKRLTYVDQLNGEDTLLVNPNPNLQIGTAYSQFDILQKVLFQASDYLRFTTNFQYSTSSDVPRYDALTESNGSGLTFAEWYYGPQNRLLTSIRTDITSTTSIFDKFILIAAYQKIDEDRIDRRFRSVNLDRQEEDVQVVSFTLDLHKYFGQDNAWEINYGAEYNHNSLSSNAFRTNIETNTITRNILTRYPSGGSTTSNLAAYALLKKSFRYTDLHTGIRYSRNEARVKYLISDDLPWPQDFYDGIQNINSALSWSLGTTAKLKYGFKLSGQVSSAFRAPNIDDLAKIRVNVEEISVPNIGLQPETSFNGEVSISKKVNTNLLISTTAFYTHLKNAIVRDNYSLPDGTSFIVDEGDTLITVSNVNANSAKVKGVSLTIQGTMNGRFEYKGSLNYLRGNRFDENDNQSPLAHIPPVYGSISGTYKYKNQQLKVRTIFNGKKPAEEYGGSEDNLENATPTGTPGWWSLNLYYGKEITKGLSLNAALENVLDVHYRPFSSGVSAPGRNLILSLHASF